jgi:uridylate kinase
MKTLVISLGGSLIVPDEINYPFLNMFRETLRKFYKTYKFVIITGGGSIARKYIEALKKDGKSELEQSKAGIRATRENALLLMQLFGKESNDYLPMNMKEVKNCIKKNNVVICAALRYNPHSTSDETSAKLASFLKTDFINLTNVSGLHNKDPNKYKNTKLIPKISWKDFEIIANKLRYFPGQHFVLDQNASKLIKRYKVKTYILGPEMSNLSNLLLSKPFIGTTIYG